MNHFPFFPKEFRDDEVGEEIERFLRPGLLLAVERTLERMRERGASEKELLLQEARVRTIRAEIERGSGVELSVAGPNLVRATSIPPGFDDTATMTAGPRHSTLFPKIRGGEKAGTGMPDSELKNRDRSPGRSEAETRR
jgi:hypothetical protein